MQHIVDLLLEKNIGEVQTPAQHLAITNTQIYYEEQKLQMSVNFNIRLELIISMYLDTNKD